MGEWRRPLFLVLDLQSNAASGPGDTLRRVCLCLDARVNPVMAVPDPSPDAGRRRQRPGRCLLRVTIGGTISVLVTSATAILRTIPIRRSVIAPLFETAVNIVPTVLRRRSGSTADQQQGGGYKSRGWLHGSSEWLADCCFHRVNFCALSAFQTVRRRNRTVIRGDRPG